MADVVMPQMGESIAEGTIVRWIKKVGDAVERDEPLFEISTDKVDAEIPSPAAGVVTEILALEGETVPVNSIVAVIMAAGARASVATPSQTPDLKVGPTTPSATTPPSPTTLSRSGPSSAIPSSAAHLSGATSTAAPSPAGSSAAGSSNVGPTFRSGAEIPRSDDDAVRQRSSPLVRKIAQEHGVDLSRVRGTGIAGRVTKDDILAFVADRGASAPASRPAAASAPAVPSTPPGGGAPGQVVPMSVMRRKIAEHMMESRRTSAHVHSVFEVNFAKVAQIREAKKADYERAGAKLTYLSFIMKASADALRAVPLLNASVEGDNVHYHQDVNIGIAVALDWGLIVPVVRNADEKNLLGLSRSIADLAERARHKHLKPDEVAGGTFTITNPGSFGAQFGLPIINQPQVAILGVGTIEKRPIVIDDAIAIRPMAFLALAYDHRIVDGAVADQFMSIVKRTIENWDASIE